MVTEGMLGVRGEYIGITPWIASSYQRVLAYHTRPNHTRLYYTSLVQCRLIIRCTWGPDSGSPTTVTPKCSDRRGGQTPLRLLTVSLIWQNQTNSRTWPRVRYLKEKCHFVLYCPLNCSLPLLIILDIVEGASICQQSFQFGLLLELSSWITTRDANVQMCTNLRLGKRKKIFKLCNSAAVGESLHICKKDSFLFETNVPALHHTPGHKDKYTSTTALWLAFSKGPAHIH